MCSTKKIHKISKVLRKVTEDISNSTVSTVYADDCRYGDNQIRIPLTCKVCIWRANCCLPPRLTGTQESGHVMHTARRSFPSRLQVYTVLHMSHMNADLLLNIVDVGTFRSIYGNLVLCKESINKRVCTAWKSEDMHTSRKNPLPIRPYSVGPLNVC